MRLTSLSESDQKTRSLERALSGGDTNALMPLATSYLRIGDPKLSELVDDLRSLGDPNAEEIIRAWAENNNIPTADEFIVRIGEDEIINFTRSETAAVNSGLAIEEYDQNGRSGYYYSVSIYRSPADGNYVWLIYGGEEGNENFNYGSITSEDLEAARTGYGGKEEWHDWGMLDYFRDYLQ